MKVNIGLEQYEATVIVRLQDKDGKTKEIPTTISPTFVLALSKPS